MDENQKHIVAHLKQTILEIEEGSLEIITIKVDRDYLEHYDCGMLDCRILSGRGTMTLDYQVIPPKKTYKTQQEIYKELYEGKYEFYMECGGYTSGYTEEECRIIANTYASACTVDAWRDQYEVH